MKKITNMFRIGSGKELNVQDFSELTMIKGDRTVSFLDTVKREREKDRKAFEDVKGFYVNYQKFNQFLPLTEGPNSITSYLHVEVVPSFYYCGPQNFHKYLMVDTGNDGKGCFSDSVDGKKSGLYFAKVIDFGPNEMTSVDKKILSKIKEIRK